MLVATPPSMCGICAALPCFLGRQGSFDGSWPSILKMKVYTGTRPEHAVHLNEAFSTTSRLLRIHDNGVRPVPATRQRATIGAGAIVRPATGKPEGDTPSARSRIPSGRI